MAETDPIPLNLTQSDRRRGVVSLVVALVIGAALGGVVGLIAGQTAGLITAGVVAGLLLLLAWASARRTLWLRDGTTVVARTIGSKSVDLRAAERLELMVTDVRGIRTVGLLVARKGTSINLALAMYSGTGGRELGILVLRKLADALARSENPAGLVFSQLLVAQLRAEAKGEAPPDRPLYRLGSLAPTGRLAQRLKPEAITRFVASLD
ncbi:hypothetical protein [Actinokineospora globicatena]|uniref:Uncharacterized protein n=1 Tax=Actinokineospora globicatena TaxID=103729 RepID=A0A9W6V614_9PSEU|nr:hypothetical protein [Actinokineospora globicatena]MCP2304208.1 hypothetical protein [Actinokineospora globicatena]GLW78434.1 hypothetical protein Aglo01_29160 [Actinokineospora globicatena]GLW84902.1 hypothetical protein Aglo02_25420 [Actinokineospora globicatena]GLW91040.1 hypothetical protein Aglo03_18560 [Actinokineospora globicatena]